MRHRDVPAVREGIFNWLMHSADIPFIYFPIHLHGVKHSPCLQCCTWMPLGTLTDREIVRGTEPLKYLEQQKQVHFLQMHIKCSLRQLFLTVSCDLHAWRNTLDGVLLSLKFGKQQMRWVGGPWRAPCQLKKPFEGPKRRRGSFWEERKRKDKPSRQINDFFYLSGPPNILLLVTPQLTAALDMMRNATFTETSHWWLDTKVSPAMVVTFWFRYYWLLTLWCLIEDGRVLYSAQPGFSPLFLYCNHVSQ